ncbi:ROK family protein [Streptacidiphilus cavernicola]|uniref:ROK family protein n=1 Tax=Streptacidiphilus cavernicola TaxID=3342716 RepID=A0ABV6VQ38_9ACTN
MAAVDLRHQEALSEVVALVAAGTAGTRSALAGATGMSRATVSQRVDTLIAAGLLLDGEPAVAARGRPPLTLRLNPRIGAVCAVDLGATHCRIRLADLGGEPLGETVATIAVADGPEAVLSWVDARLRELLARAGRAPAEVCAISMGVPGPVDFATGTPVRPPIMPGWDGYPIPSFFAGRYDAPVLVDNDVNLMALGEFAHRPGVRHLLYVKVGTGIGCGIVSDGALHRGAAGAAGDIGHVRVPGHEDVPCHCGNTGCIEAVASGGALVATLRAAGCEVASTRDVVRIAGEGNALARRQVRLAGQRLGEVLATAVSFHNPDLIVLGGSLAELHEDLLAEIRGVVYRRALPLATRSLAIETSLLGGRAGVEGAGRLALGHLLSGSGLAGLLRRSTRSARGAGD